MFSQAKLFNKSMTTAPQEPFVREAISEDIHAIGDILLSTWRDVYKITTINEKTLQEEVEQCFTENELEIIKEDLTRSCIENLNNDHHATFVACDGNKVVGFARLLKNVDSDSAQLDKIYISSEYRERGLGRLLVMNCYVAAVNRFKVNQMEAKVWDQNTKAIPSYINNGFVLNPAKGEHELFTPIEKKKFSGIEMICLNCQEAHDMLQLKIKKSSDKFKMV